MDERTKRQKEEELLIVQTQLRIFQRFHTKTRDEINRQLVNREKLYHEMEGFKDREHELQIELGLPTEDEKAAAIYHKKLSEALENLN